MTTTPIAVAALDGGGRAITVRADQNADTSVALRTSLEIGGTAVATGNPVPVAINGGSVAVSGSLPLPSGAAQETGGNLAAIAAALAAALATKPAPTATVATTQFTVGQSSTQLAGAGTMTRGWRVSNTSTGGGYIDLCWGATATAGAGFTRVYAGATDDWKGIVPPVGTAMSAIASAAGQTMTITVFN